MSARFDESDPVQVAAAWTAIIEPGDPAAGLLRARLGTVEGLRWILDPVPRPPARSAAASEADRSVPWDRCHARWRARVAELDVAADLHRIEALGGRLMPRGAPGWPAPLADLEEREPFGLWLLGEAVPGWSDKAAVSVVGSRASTSYGTRVASQVAADLAGQGAVVVSGGAYGIDAAAHRGALSARDPESPTVAVLCGGLGNLYPAGNADLFRAIREAGLLLSEVPPHWRPARWRFLERNRLIAALSSVTVVVEAGERSGAIATANRAIDLGRTVAAVPGPVTSLASRGCHRLIQDGAELVTDSSDIAALMGLTAPGGPATVDGPGLRPIERLVWDALPRTGTATTGQLCVASGLSSEEVDIALLGLKLVGRAHNTDGEWRRIGTR